LSPSLWAGEVSCVMGSIEISKALLLITVVSEWCHASSDGWDLR